MLISIAITTGFLVGGIHFLVMLLPMCYNTAVWRSSYTVQEKLYTPYEGEKRDTNGKKGRHERNGQSESSNKETPAYWLKNLHEETGEKITAQTKLLQPHQLPASTQTWTPSPHLDSAWARIDHTFKHFSRYIAHFNPYRSIITKEVLTVQFVRQA